MLTFIELTDIHFSGRPAGSPHELDSRLRNELMRDASAYAGSIGPIAGVLVCGDIAYSAEPTQYGQASDWLRDLCLALDVRSDRVWVIPGNHDVQRARTRTPQERRIRARLRELSGAQLDAELERVLLDDSDGPVLLSALDNYNDFAAQYLCDISPAMPFWVDRLPLSPCYSLCLRGLNSALISDGYDDQNRDRLVVGNMQVVILRKNRDIHVTLCHHPIDWLLCDKEFARILDSLAVLQITGHVHAHALRETQGGWHLSAGALQPPRAEEPYEPRYNFVSLDVRSGASQELALRVHPRVWDGLQFVGDSDYPNGYVEKVVPLPKVSCGESGGSQEPGRPVADAEADTLRRLTHRIALLQRADQFASARDVGVSQGPLAALPAREVPRGLVAAARQAGKLEELWSAVETYHGSQPGSINPFSRP
ncbi:MAG TPA: metallophosphoesterase [Solirubrobacteraceae bacterium]|nr:metallophosphoesterase [Solirubrobacteraceae bacterium]